MPPKKAMGKQEMPTQVSMAGDALKVRAQVKAGLTMPVARIMKQMKNARTAHRVSPGSAVAAAAVLEYLLAEIIELSGDQCVELTKKSQVSKMIKPRHIMLGIKHDKALNELVGPIMLPAAGRPEYLHPELHQKRRKKKKMAMDEESSSSDEE